MKLTIADLADDCVPENILLGSYDAAMAARIKERVMKEIESRPQMKKRHSRRTMFTLLLAAVLILALSATAYAGGLFRANLKAPPQGETVSGHWIERDGAGNVIEDQLLAYPDAGLVLTFEAEDVPEQVEFRANWLPSPRNDFARDEPGADQASGWCSLMGDWSDDGTGAVPWVIQTVYAIPNRTLVFMGECEIVKEETWDEYTVTELIADTGYMPPQNILLLFNEEAGYIIELGGAQDFETLEHMARELEVRSTGEKISYNPDFNIGVLNLGRG